MPARCLHIFYRHVHIKADKASRDPNKPRPDWFSHEACLRNLIHTVATDPLGSRVKLTVVYDGTAEDFVDDFASRYYAGEALGMKVCLIKGGSDRASFLTTLHLARTSEIPQGDLIYFLENDYMHVPGWVSKVFELADSAVPFAYASLYDHRDKYDSPLYENLTARLFYTASHHWRTAPSTCASFVVSKAVFDQDYDVLASGLTDYYFFGRLVGERGRTLVTPVPGLSTHCMNGYLSPTIDWQALVV